MSRRSVSSSIRLCLLFALAGPTLCAAAQPDVQVRRERACNPTIPPGRNAKAAPAKQAACPDRGADPAATSALGAMRPGPSHRAWFDYTVTGAGLIER